MSRIRCKYTIEKRFKGRPRYILSRTRCKNRPVKDKDYCYLHGGPDAVAQALALANVQHVCTKCGYIAVTQSVTTGQIVAQAVKERDGYHALYTEYVERVQGLEFQVEQKAEEIAWLRQALADAEARRL